MACPPSLSRSRREPGLRDNCLLLPSRSTRCGKNNPPHEAPPSRHHCRAETRCVSSSRVPLRPWYPVSSVQQRGSDAEASGEEISPRANAAKHLAPLIQRASAVWVMGDVARNAMAASCPDFPRDMRAISQCPYIPDSSKRPPKFFVSRYLTRAPEDQVRAIFLEFTAFWLRNSGNVNTLPNTAIQRPWGTRCSLSGC